MRTLVFCIAFIAIATQSASGQCPPGTPPHSSVPGATIGSGESLAIQFGVQPNPSDLLLFDTLVPPVVTGIPVITSSLFNGPVLLGTYTQTLPASRLLAVFQSDRSRTDLSALLGPPQPTRVDYSAIASGSIAGTLVIAVTGGSITFWCGTLFDAVSRQDPPPGSLIPRQDVQVGNAQIRASRTRTVQAVDLSQGAATQTIAGVQVSASYPGFALSQACGITAVGVGDGFVDGEIDNSLGPLPPPPPPIGGGPPYDPREVITFLYPRPTVVTQLTLAYLNANGAANPVNETAEVQVDGGAIYDLTATGAASFVWTGFGRVANVSPAVPPGCGTWNLVKPFGDTPVTAVKFLAKRDVFSAAGSDFAIVSMSDEEPPCAGCACPEPSADCRPDRPAPAQNLPDWIPAAYACTAGGIDVSVCNQGTAEAPNAVIQVQFGAPGGPVTGRVSPYLPVGQCSDVRIPAPAGWCGPDSAQCTFNITVNAFTTPWMELNPANNTLAGNCRTARP